MKSPCLKFFLVVFVFTISVLSLQAETAVFREGADIAALGITNYAGTQDTFIQSGANAGKNYGSSTSLYLGKTTASSNSIESKALLRFDLTALEGKFDSIDSVTLTMTFVTQSGVNTTNIDLNLYQISSANSEWVEGTANGAAQTGSSSWSKMVYNGTNWAGSDGLSTSGTDYVATVIDGTKSISSPGSSGTQYSWTLQNSLIEDWTGGTNTGLLFASSNWGDMISGDYFRFASSEYITASYRPTLTINYTAIPDYFYWTANGSSLGGAGTWNTSGSNWSVSKDSVSGAAWDSNKRAVFTNNAATVMVDTVIAKSGILFATSGYTLNNGTITLGGATISNNYIITPEGVIATINSTLVGSTGLIKKGAGTLIFGGDNTYSGGTVINDGYLIGTTASLQGAITNHAVVAFNQATNGTYSAAMAGSGSLEKAGAATVTLSGSSANTFTGKTTVREGTLQLDKATNTMAIGGDIEVKSTAILLLSTSGQIKDTSEVTLSGGTIKRGADVSEVMGNLKLTADSTLDYGTGATGILQFGNYAPSSLLTVNSFLVGNKLVFGNDLTTFVTNSSYFSFDHAFTSSWNGSTFTITAIPEPSACIAAAGLIGLMLWPCRRRLLKGLASEASTDT